MITGTLTVSYRCGVCGASCDNRDQLRIHLRGHGYGTWLISVNNVEIGLGGAPAAGVETIAESATISPTLTKTAG